MRHFWIFPLAALLGCAPAGAAEPAGTLDGITLIEFSNPGADAAITGGDFLVTFISGLGSYGAVLYKNGRNSCRSLGMEGTYTGDSITFGMDAEEDFRRVRLDVYCPVFSVSRDEDDTVIVEAQNGEYRKRHAIIAHIPLQEVDFGSAPFTTHDIKGVRFGPLGPADKVKPLSAGGTTDRVRGYDKQLTTSRGEPYPLRGFAVASEITGWDWHVLSFGSFLDQFDQAALEETFRKAVLDRYGEPSAFNPASGFSVWAYDLSGNKLDLSRPQKDACGATLELGLERDPSGKVKELNGMRPFSSDLGPWGCGLLLTISPNRGDGGVTGYLVDGSVGYVNGLNHFLQCIEPVRALKQSIESVLEAKPKF